MEPTLLSMEQEVAAEQFQPKLVFEPAVMDDGMAENVQDGAAGVATVGDATENVAVFDCAPEAFVTVTVLLPDPAGSQLAEAGRETLL